MPKGGPSAGESLLELKLEKLKPRATLGGPPMMNGIPMAACGPVWPCGCGGCAALTLVHACSRSLPPWAHVSAQVGAAAAGAGVAEAAARAARAAAIILAAS